MPFSDSEDQVTDLLRPIPASRHPFQFFTMFALGLSGASIAFSGSTPASLRPLPAWATETWGITMLIGGLLALVSAFWLDRITGLLIERIALGAIGGACAVYALAFALYYEDRNGFLNIFQFFAITVACTWRIRHIQNELHTLTRWLRLKESPDG